MSPLMRAFGIGLLFCLAQISFTWIFAPKEPVSADRYFRMIVLKDWDTSPGSSPLTTGYLRFNNWDSLRFFEIEKNGYHLPDHPFTFLDIHSYLANITTPPAYPLASRWIGSLLKLPGEVALLVTAQLGTWIFWIYFILLLMEWGIPSMAIWVSALTVAIHPAAFYMVVGYSESWFMAFTMGFIYWTERWAKGSRLAPWALAGIHGFIAAATRLPGFPIIVYPLLRVWPAWESNRDLNTFRSRGTRILTSLVSTQNLRKTLAGFGLAGVAVMGLISFFIFCQLKFGQWDIYFKISNKGWGISDRGSYLSILDPRSYIPRYFFEDTMWSINRTAVPWTLGLLILSLRLDPHWKKRMALYLTSLGLLYVSMVGKANSGMDGMIRYTLPIFPLEVALLVQILVETRWQPSQHKILLKVIALGYALALATQGWMAWRYLHGRWVS